MLQCPTCGRRYAAEVRHCTADGTPLQADATIAGYIPIDPLVGRVLDDKYRLDERLGEGGMGTVYRATHLLIDRPVAVKVLNQRFVEDEAAQTRFRREARAAGRLQHQNVAAVTDFGQTADGLVYIVMELLEGQNLREVLALEAPLDIARAVSLMLQISAAVAAAHEAGIIHRDLKPGNIYIAQRRSSPPVVKVLDFGIAKLAADAVEDHETHALTQTGVMIGTPRYMSPEQCDGAKLTPAADVYSLGIILYELLTGTTPFTGTSPLAVAVQHSSKQPQRPRELRATIPVALEELVLRALAKNPAERPADAGEFRRELYMTAQQHGLEHAAGFSAPTAHLLREAGTQTPSGRLVLDIERLRAGRAAAGYPRDTTMLADTSGNARVPTDEIAPARTEADGLNRARPFTRLRIFIKQRQERHQIRRVTPLLVAVGFVTLMLLIGAAAYMQPAVTNEPVSIEGTGDAPPPSPQTTPTPEPSPSPTPAENANKRESNKRAERRPNGRQKKDSIFGKAVKKLKKLNPFK